MLNIVDLPQPVLPRRATSSPFSIVEREPVDGRQGTEPLGDVAEADGGTAGRLGMGGWNAVAHHDRSETAR